ncbi:hypothetical protein SAMN06298216_0539 [Spirosomataceae bacterium TFI 002]|nr:hypothetical protein SAMN06298216_0539 [Spirosomataceae bacterium TFI 002]
MKKSILFSFLFLLSSISYAQVTVSGATTYPDANQAYLLNQSYFNINAQIQGFVPKDANTNSYYFDFSAMDKFWIVRKNNKWVIERANSGMALYPLYVSNTTSTEQNPPCDIVWQVWSGIQFEYGNTIAYTGNNESGITLAGSCVCPSMISTTINPTNIQLPILNNTDFNTIPNPHKGMLSYNTSLNNVPVVYDGASWNEVILNKSGTVAITGSIKYPIDVNMNSNSATAMLGVNSYAYVSNMGTVALTIPDANTSIGRQYLIVNHGTGAITLNIPIKLSYSSTVQTIAAGSTFNIISDGYNWHKVN